LSNAHVRQYQGTLLGAIYSETLFSHEHLEAPGEFFGPGVSKANGVGEFFPGPLGHAKGVLIAHEAEDGFGDFFGCLEAGALDALGLVVVGLLVLGRWFGLLGGPYWFGVGGRSRSDHGGNRKAKRKGSGMEQTAKKKYYFLDL
jgi:hypothetical protein